MRMKWRTVTLALWILVLLIAAMLLTCNAATRQEVTITITTNPAVGDVLILNGATRTWATTNGTASIAVTNSIDAARTNLYAHLLVYPFTIQFSLRYGTNTNDVIVAGKTNVTLTASCVTNWASFAYSTGLVYSAQALTVPYTIESNALRQFQMSALATNLDTYATNSLGTGAVFMAAFTPRTNGTLRGAAITDATGISGVATALTNGYWTNAVLGSPKLTNAVNYGNALSSPGTNGTASEQFGAGAQATGNYALALGANSTATNNYGVAVGPYSIVGPESSALGYVATASGANSVSIGSGSTSTAGSSIAMGSGAEATHTNSFAIGTSVVTTRTNEIRLGGSQDVVIGGLLSVEGMLSNNAVRITGGTLTNVSGAFSSVRMTNLYAHNAGLTNASIEAVSIVATSLVAHTAKLTNASVVAVTVDATNLNARTATITNGSGAFSGLTATSLVAHASSLTNANIEAASLTATNPVLLSAKATNAALDRATSTNATFAGSTVMGGAMRFPRYELATLSDGVNYGTAIGSNAFVKLTAGALTGNVTNYGFVGAMASGAAGGGGDGQFVLLLNATGYLVVLGHNGGDPNPTNRIWSPTTADLVISNGYWAQMVYDTGSSCWRVLKSNF